LKRFYREFKQTPGNAAQALKSAQCWLREVRAPTVAAFAAECAVLASREWKAPLEAEARRWDSTARRDPDALPFAHPYFWAAFMVTGA
jgi:CHAT domain-containing protein